MKVTKYSRPEVYNGKIDIKREFLLMLSNRPTLFSSKKLERLSVFYAFLIITVVYLFKKIDTIEINDLLKFTAIWLAYGGFNSILTQKDKKMESIEEVTETDTPKKDDTPQEDLSQSQVEVEVPQEQVDGEKTENNQG